MYMLIALIPQRSHGATPIAPGQAVDPAVQTNVKPGTSSTRYFKCCTTQSFKNASSIIQSVISTTLLALLIRSPLSTNASPAPQANAASQRDFGAVYVMTNIPTGNFILSSAIGRDGELTLGSAASTGGNGSSKIGGTADPLGSQDSLQVAGNRLYAVNPGSNTISTFNINPLNPTELSLVGEPVNSGGEVPISIAVSSRTGQVCVLNGGAINGVNCYKPDSQHGLVEIPDTNRLLHRNVTTPPAASLVNEPSEVLFSSDGSTLYAAVRGSTTETSFIAAWGVDPSTGALSQNIVKSPTPSGGDPFGFTLIEGTNSLLVTDPNVGFDIFDYKTPLSVANSTGIVVPGQEAICWVRYSKQTGNYYFIDLTTGVVTEVHININELQSSIVRQYPQGANATLDEEQIGTVLGKDYLYLLASGPRSIYVLSLEGPGNAVSVQHLDLTPLADLGGVIIETAFLQGIAVYTS